jgi:hypothetical protein
MSTMKKSRRTFLLSTALSPTLIPLSQTFSPSLQQTSDNENEIGPKKGYTPQIGTLVSMMNWM